MDSMDIKSVKAVAFSGAGTTREVAERFALATNLPYTLADITPHDAPAVEFEPGDLAVFAVPSYGGRVPAPAVGRIRSCHGEKIPTVLMVTFGNRAIDDTLLELADTVRAQGFIPVDGLAIVAHHSLMTNVAVGRPDDTDIALIEKAARETIDTLSSTRDPLELELNDIPGERPYRAFDGVPFHAKADAHLCVSCGRCAAECPTGAIDPAHPAETDAGLCISCTRCIATCPAGARALAGGPALAAARAAFAAAYGKRQESYRLV